MQINTYARIPDNAGSRAIRSRVSRGRAGPHDLRRALLLLAPRPAYGVTLALAGVIERAWELRGIEFMPVAGLDLEATAALFESHFPGAQTLVGSAWHAMREPAAFATGGLLDELIRLLVHHRTVEDEDSRWLAHGIATAALGSDLLWQEMYFESSALFDDLMHSFFTSLAVCNRRGQDWKMFLFERVEAERRLYAPRQTA